MRELRVCPQCLEPLRIYKGIEQLREGDLRRLRCPLCGYQRGTIEAQCWEIFPESGPIPHPKHPGEGGMGYER